MRSMTEAEAAKRLSEILRRAEADGERVVIERDGAPRAAIVPIADLAAIETGDGAARCIDADRLAVILDTSMEAIISVDADLDIQVFNRGAEEIFGYSAEDIIGRSLDTLLPARFHAAHRAHVDKFARATNSKRLMDRRRAVYGLCKDGSEFPAEASIAKSRLGGTTFLTVFLRDITKRRETEAALRESRALLGDAIESISEGFIIYDSDERFVLCNGRYRDFYPSIADILKPGTQLEAVVRASFETNAILNSAENVEKWMAIRLGQYRAARGTHEQHLEDGRWVLCSERRTPTGYTVGIRTDITAHKHAEQALRESRDQLRLITDALPVLIVYLDAEERYRFVNKTCTDWYARPVEDIVGRRVKEILGQEYEKTHPQTREALAGEATTTERTILYPDGVTRDIRITMIPHRDRESRVIGLFSLIEDITAHKRMEGQLRQALKMEALGQLTGGVAHDFNNLLGVILGNAELLQERVDTQRDLIDTIVSAAARGASLTQRLLAFARRQSLRPEAVDLGALTTGMLDMLQRTLGATIEIQCVAGAESWPAMADRGLLENAVLNLAINARDAMAGGGVLVIETGNAVFDEIYTATHAEIHAGEYAMLAVTDNGAGMSPEVLERVFEPFFTTKDVEQGSGLGLSMVHGFASQSGGHATIYSEEGKGTTVKLYLPRATEPTEYDEAAVTYEEEPRGRGETVLVVDDNPGIRRLAVTMLETLGYRTLAAEDGKTALALLAESTDVDLLVTDVVLPGALTGPRLAAEACRHHAALKVLFMSGFAGNAADLNGWVSRGVDLLDKPFRKRTLARKVRAALDSEAR